MTIRERPFLIRNVKTGAEFEIATLDKFEKAYGDNPDWYIATGPNRQPNRQLGERASAEQEDAGGGDDVDESESMAVLPDGDLTYPVATPYITTVDGESENT